MARQYANLQALAQVAIATVTTTGSQASIGASGSLRDFISGIVILAAAAGGGTTPSFTVNLQSSPDNSTWTTIATFTVTANGIQVASVDAFNAFLRMNVSAATGTSPTAALSMIAQSLGAGHHFEPGGTSIVNS